MAKNLEGKNCPKFQADATSAQIVSNETYKNKNVVISGGGDSALDWTLVLSNIAKKVTLIHRRNQFRGAVDSVNKLQKLKDQNKLDIITPAAIQKLNGNQKLESIDVKVDDEILNLETDFLIPLYGLVPKMDIFKSWGLETEKNAIKVNNALDYKTNLDGIYAIGDLVGPPWLAHKAMHEAIICVEKITNVKNVKPLNTSNIPGCTYSIPQVASIGMTEKQAKDKGYNIKVGKFPFKANGKAIALGEEEGFIKTIFDTSTGELLGAHMIGVDVTELIQGYSIAKNIEATEEDLMHTVFPHPTLSEMMHESVLDAFNKAIHF